MITRLTHKVLLAIACCFALVCVMPLAAGAQGGIIKKGAQGVKKGVETGVEKTKEGVETVGRETKEVFTGEDTDKDKDTHRMKSSESQSTATEQPSRTETTAKSTTTTKTTSKSTTAASGHRRLPRTAGHFPLLALAGALALAASGTHRLLRRPR